MRVYIERVKEYVHRFWIENRDEIIKSASNENGEKECKRKDKAQSDADIKRTEIAIRIPFIMGIVYEVIGIILLLLTIYEKIQGLDAQHIIISIELIILGVYALLYAAISYSECKMWKEYRFTRVVRLLLIILMFPYHLCIKAIKGFIKDIRQEHVAYLFPYYLISAMMVMFTYILIINVIVGLKFDEMFNEVVGFGIVFFLLNEFFWLGKVFAYFNTKSIIKSVQKAEIKKVSKINWRGTLNDSDHKKERKDKFVQEWDVVKKELEYSKIYFYIILVVLVLWIPKEDGTLQELLINQFLGITTIAALAREATSKKENGHN